MHTQPSSSAQDKVHPHRAMRSRPRLLAAWGRKAVLPTPERAKDLPTDDSDDLEFLRRLREAGL